MNPHIIEIRRDGDNIFFTTNTGKEYVVKKGEGVLLSRKTYGLIILDSIEYEIELDQISLIKKWSRI